MIFFIHVGHYEAWTGSLHPTLVHFPIVLFTLTLLADIFLYREKKEFLMVGSWLLWGGTLLIIPTAITGWMASEHFSPDNPNLFKHLTIVICLAFYAVLYSLFRLWAVLKKKDYPAILYLVLSFILLGLTSWASDKGGILSHGESPFSNPLEEPASEK
jgi:uncharacterized membrane protein